MFQERYTLTYTNNCLALWKQISTELWFCHTPRCSGSTATQEIVKSHFKRRLNAFASNYRVVIISPAHQSNRKFFERYLTVVMQWITRTNGLYHLMNLRPDPKFSCRSFRMKISRSLLIENDSMLISISDVLNMRKWKQFLKTFFVWLCLVLLWSGEDNEDYHSYSWKTNSLGKFKL